LLIKVYRTSRLYTPAPAAKAYAEADYVIIR
jgi:hypothetical protein